jgi:4-hydroxy-3-polyprenylbenzoate decarboxylase
MSAPSLPRSDRPRKIVVVITGASGAPYAKRVLELLAARKERVGDVDVGVCLSSTAPEVWALECGGNIRESLPFPVWGLRDYRAPFASGSAGWDAMVIVPCSMGTVSRVATGASESLLTRAADVMLKERRPLLLVPRETPLSTLHLRNLATLSELGATILPAMPSFYRAPTTVLDLVDSVVQRILDHLGFDERLLPRWGDEGAPTVKHD